MKILLSFGAITAGVIGIGMLMVATTGTEVTAGMLLLVVAAVLVAGYAVVRCIEDLAGPLLARFAPPPATPTPPTETDRERQVREVAARLIPAAPTN